MQKKKDVDSQVNALVPSNTKQGKKLLADSNEPEIETCKPDQDMQTMTGIENGNDLAITGNLETEAV